MPKAFNPNPNHGAIPILVRLHADLGGKIGEAKKEAARLADAMQAVETVIRLFDPAYDVRRIAVGRNVLSWRIARGMSQTQLGNRLGVSFQQVQKYEAGGNRIPAGRLVETAATLGVPISALFEGTARADPSQSLLALVSDSRSFRLARAFAAIKHRTARLSLVHLVENIAAAAPQPKRRRRRK